MEAWREAWRTLATKMPKKGLEALRSALLHNDSQLIQGRTTQPVYTYDRNSEENDVIAVGACVISFVGWQGLQLKTIIEVRDYFFKNYDKDAYIPLIKWFDDTKRDEMRKQLLPEVNRSLALLEEDAVKPDIVVENEFVSV